MSAAEEGKKDNIGTYVAVFVMVIVMVMLWPIYRPYVARMVLTIAAAECKIVGAFHPLLSESYKRKLIDVYRGSSRLLATPGVEHLANLQMRQVLAAWNVPSLALLPGMLIIVGVGIWHVRSTDVVERFRRRYSLEDLIKAQAEFYPHLRPIAKVRIDKLPLRSGDWRVKMTDIEFALRYQLLRDGAGALVEDESYALRAAYFDAARATAVFERQLGPRWDDDLDKLLPHQQAVFGMLAAMVCRDRSTAIAVARELNSSWRPVKGKNGRTVYSVNASRGRAAARKYWDHPAIRKIRRAHAYYLTVMSGLAALKRNAGELACSHYIWLRPTDPLLFFTLHQEGLPRPHLESAAAFVHFELERRAGMAIRQPEVEKAVTALRKSLIESGWLDPGQAGGGAAAVGRDWTGRPAGGFVG